jgi:hypothetical protein
MARANCWPRATLPLSDTPRSMLNTVLNQGAPHERGQARSDILAASLGARHHRDVRFDSASITTCWPSAERS